MQRLAAEVSTVNPAAQAVQVVEEEQLVHFGSRVVQERQLLS